MSPERRCLESVTNSTDDGLTAYLYRCFEFEEDGLVYEDFSNLRAQVFDFVFLQLYWLSWTISSHYRIFKNVSQRQDKTVVACTCLKRNGVK